MITPLLAQVAVLTTTLALMRLPWEGPDLGPIPLLLQVAFLQATRRRVLPLKSLAMGTVANECNRDAKRSGSRTRFLEV